MAKKSNDRILTKIFNGFEEEAPGRQSKAEILGHKLETFKGMINAVSDPMTLVNEECRIVWANQAAERIFQIVSVCKACETFFPKDKIDCDSCHIKKILKDGGNLEHEMDYQGRDGKNATFRCLSSRITPNKTGPKTLVTVFRDISNQKYAEMVCDDLENQIKDRTKAIEKNDETLQRKIKDLRNTEKALRESEKKYRLIVENANDAIFVMQDGKIMFFNLKAHEIGRDLGVNLTTSCFTHFIHPEDRGMVADRHLRRQKGESLPANYSFRLKNSNGHIMWVDLNSVLITWGGQPATLNFMRDITAQKNLEIRLFNTQKLESLGTIASGIAHDFNNLLMAIQGNVSLMSLDIERNDPQYESLKNIEGCVKSGSELTRQLLGFAKGSRYELKPTDLNELIQKSSDMFGHTRKEIHIQTKFNPNLWPVEIDQGQITQALMNIYLNAWQAMPGGGDLVLVTENIEFDEVSAELSDLKPGRYVRIEITDDGIGMDEETLGRVFEPFFTTKEKGNGTGLGLTSAYGAISNHGGLINVSSSKGEGSTFSIYLRATDKKIKNEETHSEPLLRGEGTLLLVDDEEIILNIGVKLLQKLGYEVITARNGFEAIEIYEANRDSIDMVLLDLVMPGMDGGETYDRLKALNPDIKALLSSGYSVGGKASEILRRGCNGFLQKPYRIKALSIKIGEILKG